MAAALSTVIVESAEPVLLRPLQHLLDWGLKDNACRPWWAAAAVVGLFMRRGAKVFLSQRSTDLAAIRDTQASRRSRGEAAIAAANLETFSKSVPEDLNSTAHGGSRRSDRPRKSLPIAKAIDKDATILIFDEATSALDYGSERLGQALERPTSGRASFLIAYQFSTVKRADRIIVVKRGRIVEQGTRTALLAGVGVFAKPHSRQIQE